MSGPHLGIVIVTFNSEDVILDCLESLLSASGVNLTIAIVDNGSIDNTLQLLRGWADGTSMTHLSADIPFRLLPSPKPIVLWHPDTPTPPETPGHRVVLIETGLNGGFAAGVNRGLAYLASQSQIDRFWVLNPDSVVPPDTPSAFANMVSPPEGFALMGGRVLYLNEPDIIQIDGGKINWLTGITHNINRGSSHTNTSPADSSLFDFITGASVVASRDFYTRTGPICEDYFLYYEEVDWAMNRGDLPLMHCPNGIVYHRAGTSIGSAGLTRAASAFSTYFRHRSRFMFIKKFNPISLPIAFMWSLLKATQLWVQGQREESKALMAATLNLLPPSSVQAGILKNKAILPKNSE